jgi:hypothetical protein
MFLCTISEIAISKSDQNIEIYKKSPTGYDLTATLSEHGQRVTGIDWDAKHNRIVTSGAVSLASVKCNVNVGIKQEFNECGRQK